MEATGVANISCLKRFHNVLSNVTYSPSHHQSGASMIIIQSTLRTAPDLCKKVSFAVLFGSNGNPYYSPHTIRYEYTHTYYSQYRNSAQAKEIRTNWGSSECRVPRKSTYHFGHARRRFVISAYDVRVFREI